MTTGDAMDFEIRQGDNGRIIFDLDRPTAWAFAKRMGEVVGVSDEEMKAVYGEIYSE
jgi:hypothetical protein